MKIFDGVKTFANIAIDLGTVLFRAANLSDYQDKGRVDGLSPTPYEVWQALRHEDLSLRSNECNETKKLLAMDVISDTTARHNATDSRLRLSLILVGQEHEKKLYEKRRLIETCRMPAWVIELCKQEIKNTFRIAQSNTRALRNIESEQKKELDEKTINLHLLKTFTEMEILIKECQDGLKALDKDKTDLKPGTRLNFSPASTSPLGAVALSAFEKSSKILLTARILLDSLDVLNAQLDENQLKMLVSKHSENPWNVVNDRGLKRMFQVRQLICASENKTLKQQMPTLLKIAFVAWPEAIPDPTKEALKHSASKATKNRASDGSKRVVSGSLIRNEVIDGISRRLASLGSPVERAVARQIYKLISRGALTLDDLDQQVRRRLDPVEIITQVESRETERQDREEREQPQIAAKTNSSAAKSAVSNTLRAEPKAMVAVTAAAKATFGNLNLDDQRKAFNMLLSLKQEGLSGVGDWKHLTDPAKVIELRNDAVRVYLCQTGKDEYTVLLIGNKNTQRRDIPKLRRLGL